MRLTSIQVFECFGFRDSGLVQFDSEQQFFFILGRNSSGKTSLLNAIKHLEFDVKPSDHPNFKNYNPSGNVSPRIRACFEMDSADLSVKTLASSLRAAIMKAGMNAVANPTKDRLVQQVVDEVTEIYGPFIEELLSEGRVWVDRYGAGEYRLFTEGDPEAHKARATKVSACFRKAAPDDRVQTQNPNAQHAVRLSSINIEETLFFQFPKIYFFSDEFALQENLPDRIDSARLNNPKNDLEKAFFSHLGAEDLSRFLHSEDPDERSSLLARIQRRVESLANSVNSSGREAGGKTDLLEFVLHAKEGIQVTVKADGKKCYYRHLSDNTKFLVAYHLHTNSSRPTEAVMLFDEPNKGFHPSGESFLLSFLHHLVGAGNHVLVATHSQYLVDTDLLANFKVMGSDQNGSLVVKNNPFRRARKKGDQLALQPLLDAIGLRYGSGLTLHDNLILVEGVSDLLYLQAFDKATGGGRDLQIAPGRGDGSLLNIIPFVIAQGVGFKILIDTGAVTAKIQKLFMMPESAIWEVPVHEEFKGKFRRSGIEDIFSKSEFGRILNSAGVSFKAPEFDKKPNSQCVGDDQKILVAKHVLDEVSTGALRLSKETTANVQRMLDFCTNSSWFRL